MRAASLIAAVLALCPPAGAQERTHPSQVLGGTRGYHVFLPANYAAAAASAKKYPVIYWLHGYEAGAEEREAQLHSYAAAHDVILIDSGPVETAGNYPLYLAELIEQVDRTLRTFADRDHRGVSGYGTGGFLALWEASKSPDLVGSASAVSPSRSAGIGPQGFDADATIEDLPTDYDAVRTLLLNSETTLPDAFDFHLKCFASPLPRPKLFSHADPYPNFEIWGWTAASSRRRPAFTLLENLSNTGFRSEVREWLPGGAAIPEVKLSVTTPARTYLPGSLHKVTYIRLADSNVRRAAQKADAQGRITFDLDGAVTEIGVGERPVLALASFELEDAAWAAAGKSVKARLRFWNKGGERSLPATLKFESPTPGVTLTGPARLPALDSGASIAIPIIFIARSALRGAMKIVATTPSGSLAIEIPIFPDAPKVADFQIEGAAQPGESFAIALPPGRAEIYTNDPCLDTTVRVTTAGGRYTQATVRAGCQPGHIVHLLARTPAGYFAIDLPIQPRP